MSDMGADDDDALRRAFAGAPARGRAGEGASAEVVDAERLWIAASGQAPPAEVASLADRMVEDHDMAEDWRIAAAFAEAEAECGPLTTGEDEHEADSAANTGHYGRWLVIAGSLAAALVLVVLIPRDSVPRYEAADGQLRAGGHTPITTDLGTQPLDRDTLVLRWTGIPEATSYRVQVTTESLEPVYDKASLVTPEAPIPAKALSTLPAETWLLWRVEGVMSNGTRVSSQTFRLQIK